MEPRRPGGTLLAGLLAALLVVLVTAPIVMMRLLDGKDRRTAPARAARTFAPTPTATTGAPAPRNVEIERYLEAVEQVLGEMGGWREDFSVLAAVVAGEVERGEPDIDGLVASHHEWLRRLSEIPAPAACAGHKGLAIQIMRRRLEAVEHVQRALARGATGEAAALAAAAPEIEARQRELKEAAITIRLQHGL